MPDPPDPDPAGFGAESNISGGGRMAALETMVLELKVETSQAATKITEMTTLVERLTQALRSVGTETQRAISGLGTLSQKWDAFRSSTGGGMAVAGASAGLGIMGAAAARYAPGGAIPSGFQAYENAAMGYVMGGMGGPNGGASTFSNVVSQMSQMGVGGFGTQDTAGAFMTANRLMGMQGANTMLGVGGGGTVGAQLTGTSLTEGTGTAAGMYSPQVINNLQRMGGIMVQPGGVRRDPQEIALEVLRRAANGRKVTPEMLDVLAPGSDMYVNLIDMLGDPNLVEQVIQRGRANISLKGNMMTPASMSQADMTKLGITDTYTGALRTSGEADSARVGGEYTKGGLGAAIGVVEMGTMIEDFKSKVALANDTLLRLAAQGGMVVGSLGGLAAGAGQAAAALMMIRGGGSGQAMATQTGNVAEATSRRGGMGAGASAATSIAGIAAGMVLPQIAAALAPHLTEDPVKQQQIASAGNVLGSMAMWGAQGAVVGSALGGNTLIGAGVGAGVGFFMGGGPQLIGSMLGDAVTGTTGGNVNMSSGVAGSNSLQAGGGMSAIEARAYVTERSNDKASMGPVPDYFIIKLAKLFQRYPNLRAGGGWRSRADQERLYRDHCDANGNCHPKTAKPGTSNHEVGLAVDLDTRTLPWGSVSSGNAAVAPYGLHLPVSTENWHIQPTEVKRGAQSPEGLATLNGQGLDPSGGTGLGSGNPSFLATEDSDPSQASGGGGGTGGGGGGALGYSEAAAVAGGLAAHSAPGAAMNVGGGGGGATTGAAATPVGGGGAWSGDPGTALSAQEMVRILYGAGFRGEELVTAAGISSRESGWIPGNKNFNAGTGDKSYGLFQINMLGSLGPARLKQYGLSSADELYNPNINAQVAYKMAKEGAVPFYAWGPYKGMSPTYNVKPEKMDEARAAAKTLGYMSGDAVQSAVGGHITHAHTWNVNIGRGSVEEMERMITEMETRANNRTSDVYR